MPNMNGRKKVGLFAASISLVILLVAPSWVAAGPTIEEVRKNVENMYKSAMEATPHVMAKDVKKQMDSGEEFVLVDIRTREEYDAAHLQGALYADRGLLEWMVPHKIPDPDARIYLYCRAGARGALAAKRLMELGYTNVTNIYDGFRGWVMEGFPVYNRHGEFTLSPDGFEKKER